MLGAKGGPTGLSEEQWRERFLSHQREMNDAIRSRNYGEARVVAMKVVGDVERRFLQIEEEAKVAQESA